MKNQCEAAIAVKRNRVKTYNSNVYLSDRQEFEIELFNPTTSTKLAKISMNGKLISKSGVVLKPGQRVYLERYLDSPKKFLFETYDIDGNDAQAIKAIQDNGTVSVDFFSERDTKVVSDFLSGFNTSNSYKGRPVFDSLDFTRSASTDNLMKFSSFSSSCNPSLIKSMTLNSFKETGRIEQGSSSNQKFETYSGDFERVASCNVTIKILPLSEKPVEIEELANYCSQCGTKNKGGKYKYCPTCGNKFGDLK